MLKAIYIILAIVITSAAQAETRTVLVNPSQSKTLSQPHASGANCTTGQVRVSITKSPKIGKITIADKKIKGCNGKRVAYRPTSGEGKDSATVKVTYPNGSSKTTKYKLKIK